MTLVAVGGLFDAVAVSVPSPAARNTKLFLSMSTSPSVKAKEVVCNCAEGTDKFNFELLALLNSKSIRLLASLATILTSLPGGKGTGRFIPTTEGGCCVNCSLVATTSTMFLSAGVNCPLVTAPVALVHEPFVTLGTKVLSSEPEPCLTFETFILILSRSLTFTLSFRKVARMVNVVDKSSFAVM